jgi:16S rRNA (uracil1498-N3)-methyltransferase
MRIPRIYTEQSLSPGSQVTLESAPSRHLIQVLRMRADMELTLFNGDGHDYPARLLRTPKQGVVALVEAISDEEPSGRLDIHLGIGVSKGERMDYALQKSVELGVTGITPLFTERSVVHLKGERLGKRLDHWRRIVISACEQSGRKRLPLLHSASSLQDWLATSSDDLSLLLDHRAAATLPQLPEPSRGSIRLLVGPEGGLSSEERRLAVERGFQSLRLGPRIMRTETTPLAAIAAMQALWGDFR